MYGLTSVRRQFLSIYVMVSDELVSLSLSTCAISACILNIYSSVPLAGAGLPSPWPWHIYKPPVASTVIMGNRDTSDVVFVMDVDCYRCHFMTSHMLLSALWFHFLAPPCRRHIHCHPYKHITASTVIIGNVYTSNCRFTAGFGNYLCHVMPSYML